MANYPIQDSLHLSQFLQFLITNTNEGNVKLPAISDISRLLNISQPALREQLEQAKILGLVTIKPKTGIRCLPYSFAPAVQESIKYAIQLDKKYFTQLSEMRKGLEKAFWFEAVTELNKDDIDLLNSQLESAQSKLRRYPAEIPHQEHRTLHMAMYRHLNNTFIKGVMEGFWYAYEIVGMNQYSDIEYLKKVWNYHSMIVRAIIESDLDLSFRLLMEHLELIQTRGNQMQKHTFE